MKFPLQYAKILSQKYLNIDDDIIPEIEMCLEREGDKVSLPFNVEEFAITINHDNYIDGNGYGSGDYNDGYNGDGYGDGNSYGDGNDHDTDYENEISYMLRFDSEDELSHTLRFQY